ncbi:hypothetical protein D3C80_1264420 [compost metagenome]
MMKCSGKRSFLSISSFVSGSMKIFAKGVAVYPTYDERREQSKSSRIRELILVVALGSFAVLMEALSASSSINSIGPSS